MRKKILFLLLCFVLILGVMSCGDSVSKETKSEEELEEERLEEEAKGYVDLAIEDLKSNLKNPHSLKILDEVTVTTGNGDASIDITFSAENLVGGTVEGEYKGIYSDGSITMRKIDTAADGKDSLAGQYNSIDVTLASGKITTADDTEFYFFPAEKFTY